MKLLDAAYIVLKDAGKPLNYKEITTLMIERGLYQTYGKTPSFTVSSRLSEDIRNNTYDSRFKKISSGLYTIKEYDLESKNNQAGSFKSVAKEKFKVSGLLTEIATNRKQTIETLVDNINLAERNEMEDIYPKLLTLLKKQDVQDEPSLFEEVTPNRIQLTSEPPSESVLHITSPDQIIIEKLMQILVKRFTNGLRIDSPIELTRFRSFAAEDLGEEILLSDQELKSYIAGCGTTFDGKVYAVSVQTKERIRKLVEDYFADGAQAIFYSEFYAKNENWLFEAHVVSEEMLIGILRLLFPTLSFTSTYFGFIDASIYSVLECEILHVWGDDVLLTYMQLAERLHYIPLDRIKYALGQNGNFIWSSLETFSHVNRVSITEEEREAIREVAMRKCNANGYVLISDLPFWEIEERNNELSIVAVYKAVYQICLSDRFNKKGKIVTRKGDVFDALTIMKKYCRTVDKCSFDDLLNIENELTGMVRRQISLEAGSAILVRIDKDTYVADRHVHFNVDKIDEVIEFFVKGGYLPLKSFTAFGAFPECGQEWNLFLLESYCRRFSRRFRFDTPMFNSRNAGVVISKSCMLNYTEIMTDAVVNADISLKSTDVGKFLYESGYTGRSTTTKASEIIAKAKGIRKRRN